MNILAKVIIGIVSILFLMIGADKFFSFLQPPCTLQESIPSSIWIVLGGLQIASGILIWNSKFRKYIAGFFLVFMLFFIVVHLTQNTYDIGGAVFMAALLGLIVWNPEFMGGNSSK